MQVENMTGWLAVMQSKQLGLRRTGRRNETVEGKCGEPTGQQGGLADKQAVQAAEWAGALAE